MIWSTIQTVDGHDHVRWGGHPCYARLECVLKVIWSVPFELNTALDGCGSTHTSGCCMWWCMVSDRWLSVGALVDEYVMVAVVVGGGWRWLMVAVAHGGLWWLMVAGGDEWRWLTGVVVHGGLWWHMVVGGG
jgi:hypothetical protein